MPVKRFKQRRQSDHSQWIQNNPFWSLSVYCMSTAVYLNILNEFLCTRVCGCVFVTICSSACKVGNLLYSRTRSRSAHEKERENGRKLPKAPCSSISKAVEGVECSRMDCWNVFFLTKLCRVQNGLNFDVLQDTNNMTFKAALPHLENRKLH